METKDYLTLSLSSLAIILSFITWAQKFYETRRTIRNQITDVMSKLASASIELEKARKEVNKDRGTLQFIDLMTKPIAASVILEEAQKEIDKERGTLQSGAIVDKLRRYTHSLAQQADYLMRKKPWLVSGIEYANVALAFETVNDPYMAEIYWNLAINASSKPFEVDTSWFLESVRKISSKKIDETYKSNTNYLELINTRRYAAFLYSLGKEAYGNEMYKRAINLIKEEDGDRAFWEKGFAYRRWARSVTQNKWKDESLEKREKDVKLHLEEARQSYKNIKNVDMANKALKELATEEKEIMAILKSSLMPESA